MVPDGEENVYLIARKQGGGGDRDTRQSPGVPLIKGLVQGAYGTPLTSLYSGDQTFNIYQCYKLSNASVLGLTPLYFAT